MWMALYGRNEEVKINESDLHFTFHLNCTDNYDVVKIKVKSVTDHQ